MRVFFISFCCVAVLVLGLMGVRQWALMTPSQRFDHGFLDSKPAPHFVVQVEKLQEAEAARALWADVILWLDLRSTGDGTLLVLRPDTVTQALTMDALGVEKWKGAVFSRYTEAELRVLFPEAVRLQDFLEKFPEQRFIFNIIDNADNVHQRIIEIADALKPEQRFLFQSDTDIILKSIKNERPLWLFGSSRPDLMKILTFESIGMESASPFRGDVFISPFQLSNRNAFNDGVLLEMHRRHKDIFIGPLYSLAEIEKARALKPEGYIFSSVQLFQEAQSKP